MNKKVSVIQMTSCTNVDKNLACVSMLVEQVMVQKPSLIVLPENFAYMGLNEADKLNQAEVFGEGVIQDTISQLAKKHGVWIVAGTIPIKSEEPSRCFASSLVFNAQGECIKRYDKIHLFDVQVSATEAHKESNSTCAGNELAVVDTPVGRIGLSVCYDVRFPELYRQLRDKCADIFIVPAAFTFDTGKVHWQVLLQARAIENLCYVLASNQGGVHQNGRKTFGHSMIISPWGKIEANLETDDISYATAEIDMDAMHKRRQIFPCLEHRMI